MPWPQTGATQDHAQLGLPDKGHAIKELVVCNNWVPKPFELLKRSGPRLLSTVAKDVIVTDVSVCFLFLNKASTKEVFH